MLNKVKFIGKKIIKNNFSNAKKIQNLIAYGEKILTFIQNLFY